MYDRCLTASRSTKNTAGCPFFYMKAHIFQYRLILFIAKAYVIKHNVRTLRNHATLSHFFFRRIQNVIHPVK